MRLIGSTRDARDAGILCFERGPQRFAALATLAVAGHRDELFVSRDGFLDDLAKHVSSISNIRSDASNLERINRWNPDALDPNRNFKPDSPVPESAALLALQNLNRTNDRLGDVQNRISTGLKVQGARDNAAIWAVAERRPMVVSHSR